MRRDSNLRPPFSDIISFTLYHCIIVAGDGLIGVWHNFFPLSFQFEKLWDVEADGEGQDGDDVVAGRPGLRMVVERVADREVSEEMVLNRFRDCKFPPKVNHYMLTVNILIMDAVKMQKIQQLALNCRHSYW